MPDNVFDDPGCRFHVLVNHEDQYSIWPTFLPIPGGWTVVLDDCDRRSALECVEKAWTDMRPASLARELDATTVSGHDESDTRDDETVEEALPPMRHDA
jgi:MbtH protein